MSTVTSAPATNRQWRLVSRPKGGVSTENLQWVEEQVPPLAEGEVLVRSVYLSLDPANRGWMNETASYVPPVPLGEVMRGIAIGTVVASRNPGFAPGDHVQGLLGWQEYLVTSGAGLNKLPPLPVPLIAHFGVLGHIGLTAYFGLLEVGRPKAGETLVVSAAAGAVGSLVGQIGKIAGCRVVGIAGSDDKCAWITAELGFDAAINYKKEPVAEGLRRACPNGIDVYFENVGGAILDAVLGQVNQGARIPLCGLISMYNSAAPVPGPYAFGNILVKRVRVEGFLVMDFLDRAGEAIPKLLDWHLAGKLKYRTQIVPGLENAPAALSRLFDGSNTGKLVVQVS